MIANDSPLRRLPARLDRRQVLFFDGLRVTAQMAGLAYHRLDDLLPMLQAEEPTSPRISDFVVQASIEAWTVVDSTFRFRQLVLQFPRLKKSLPSVQLFNRRTAQVEWFRNLVQHLTGEIDSLAEQGRPLLGTVTWHRTEQDGTVHFYVAVPGSFYPDVKAESAQFDFLTYKQGVCLVVAGRMLHLSDALTAVEELIRGFEADLLRQFPDERPNMADVFTIFSMTPLKEEP